MRRIEVHKKAQATPLGILPWVIVTLGAIFYCYEYFLRIAPSVMSHQVMQTYHLTAAGFGKLAAFYLFAYTPMQVIVGVLLDRYGARFLLAGAALICAVGAFLFADSHSLMMAQTGRLFVGFGSAFAFVGALKLTSIWLPPQFFASVTGVIAGLGTVGAMVGDNVLGKLVQLEGWRMTTFLSAAVGIGLAVVLFLIVRDSADPHPDVSAVPPLSYRDVFRSLFHSLKRSQFWMNGVIGALLYLAMSTFADLWGIPYMRQAHHLSATAANLTVSFTYLGFTVGAPLMGIISDRLKLRRPILMVGALVAAGLITVVLYSSNLSIWLLDVLLFLFGMFAGAQGVVFAVGREVADKSIAGSAVALTNMFVMLGGVIFQPLIGKMLDLRWTGQMVGNIRHYSTADYRFALTVLPIALIVAFVISLFLKETHAHLTRGA
jgi:MFS family permease